MKEKLEFIHDTNNSKIWEIEKIGNKIYIKFGKKGKTLQEKLFSFKTNTDAKNEYTKRLNEKLKKGYVKINTSKKEIKKENIKKISKKISKKNSKKNSKKQSKKIINNINNIIQSGHKINTVNEIIYFILNIAKKVVSFQYNLEKIKPSNTSDIEYKVYEKTTEFFRTKYKNIPKQIEKIQNKKIAPFLTSGIIVKNINKNIRTELLNKINSFNNIKNPDYHPGSNNRVLDIVHPSLYPYIKKDIIKKDNLDFWGRPYENSKYQWLPSEFNIDANGKCKIETYINNLPITEKALYEDIETLFNTILPLFEDIWSYSKSFDFYKNDREQLNKSFKNDDVLHKLSLKNRKLQVITKIVKISLKDNDIFLGAWHVEGMSHENIVATASCTLEQDESFDASIYFKRTYSSREVDTILSNMPQDPIEPVDKLIHNVLVPLGKVKIKEGSLIVFPNSHIHKIDMFSNVKKEQFRTILVFWLINPDIRITSTKDIPQQNYKIENAYKERLELMKERTFYKQSFNQREINLCEH